MTDDPARFAHLSEGNARQARKRVSVDLLIRDETGRVLLVDPTYKEHWDLPGGMAEANEPPRQAGERELREELGVTVTPGRLLVLDWVPPHGPWDDLLAFIFDAGVLTAAQISSVTLQDEELSAFGFYDLAEAVTLLPAALADRLTRAHTALTSPPADYREQLQASDFEA